MRRITATLAVATLALAACGGGDDEPAAEEPAAEAADEPADEPASEPTDEPADEPVVDEPADEDDSTFFDDDDDDGDTIQVDSLDDVPEACRELMKDFLQEIEPLVSPIDWDNASLADFESVAADFEEISEQFDEASAATDECDNIEMEDEDDFQLLIDFAGDVAPGTVSFMTFISGFASAAGEMADGSDDVEDIGALGGEAAFDDCDGAIAYIQGLIDQYDSMTDIPIAEMTQIANLGTVMMTCTPEQLEFIDSPEVTDFFGG